jgi:hypothetical protein
MLSNYFENQLIDFLFRGASYTPPARLYFALCTELPDKSNTGSNIAEVSGGNYARRVITSGTAGWYTTQGDTTDVSTGTSGNTSNVAPISWSNISWSARVTSVAICDGPTGGNLIYFANISKPVHFPAGSNINFNSTELKLNFS